MSDPLDDKPKNPQWNEPQWNDSEFQEWQPYAASGAVTVGAGTVSCQIQVRHFQAIAVAGASTSAAIAVRRRQSQPAALGGSSSTATAARRRRTGELVAGASTGTACFILRKPVALGTAGMGIVIAGVRRNVNLALLTIGTSHAEARLAKLALPPPARGDMRVGRWTRPAPGVRLRVHSWPSV